MHHCIIKTHMYRNKFISSLKYNNNYYIALVYVFKLLVVVHKLTMLITLNGFIYTILV
jgi:hypothetical protein